MEEKKTFEYKEEIKPDSSTILSKPVKIIETEPIKTEELELNSVKVEIKKPLDLKSGD